MRRRVSSVALFIAELMEINSKLIDFGGKHKIALS